ncbi:RagB/SusD family nutrient uptake outer membrane protein [Elizabethkingia sp. JS20170427COW]|uniref:RagB/SusD family nutrient uptake outer membrane protein n=1 Tax=Elizabethkingia sp. JS20170427COW TaxID=2583851 RepID=UPI0011108210|nr:RagB/SusD family nutrient uptake outer membrane protein [Elizabethkingia sp. JS20170427COW]QCX53448.1 RagB/SusD family nutrient uptake outer membrane protein [Elizabethkingia sp. JS20170427COW]
MKKYIFSLIAASFLLTSCDREESLLQTEPQGNVSADQIQNLLKAFPEKATTVLGGAEAGNNNYLIQFNTNGASAHDDFGYMSVRTGLDHMTNDLVMTQSHWFNSYYNYLARGVSNSRTQMVWKYEYKVIYNMNEVLKQLLGAQEGDSKHIKGRALAMRANAYMDLLLTYSVGDQGVPYYSKGDRVVENPGRLPVSQVWNYIIEDLTIAYDLLQDYTRADKQSIDKNVVAGFLARAFMASGNYSQAATFANLARQGYAPMNSTQLKDGFQFISNPEWMWGADINSSTATLYASFFSHMSNLNQGYAGLLGVYRTIDSRLYNQIPATDERKSWFLSASQNGLPKYANVKFYDNTFFEGDYVFMRAAEFYLIEAEALARSNNESGAKAVLEQFVKTRDASYSAASYSGAALLKEIRKQRRIELWGEGGEWWEMKRNQEDLVRDYTGSNHATFGKLNISHTDNRFIFQIPQVELDVNKEVNNP